MALSVEPALSEPPRPLAGMLPCGDRTFLLAGGPKPVSPSDRPYQQAQAHSRKIRHDAAFVLQ